MNTSAADVSLPGIHSGLFFSPVSNHRVLYCTFTETLSRPSPSLSQEPDGGRRVSVAIVLIATCTCKLYSSFLPGAKRELPNSLWNYPQACCSLWCTPLHARLTVTHFNYVSLFKSLLFIYLKDGVKPDEWQQQNSLLPRSLCESLPCFVPASMTRIPACDQDESTHNVLQLHNKVALGPEELTQLVYSTLRGGSRFTLLQQYNDGHVSARKASWLSNQNVPLAVMRLQQWQ